MANQTTAGDEDGQLIGNVGKVDLSRFSPMIKVGFRFLGHETGIRLQTLVSKSRKQEAHLFVHHFRTGVIGYTPAENRNCKLISFFRAQLFIARLEERLVPSRSRQHSHLFAGEQERKNLAELFAAATDEPDRVPLELQG